MVGRYAGSCGVSGDLVDRDVARHAAHRALRILDGEDASRLPIVKGSFVTPIFDWRQLNRFGISEHNLPPGSTKKPHWLRAGKMVVAAVEDGASSPQEMREVTDALVDALDVEGWMEAAPPTAPEQIKDSDSQP